MGTTNKLSIKAIKEEISKAFLEDVRIMKAFSNPHAEKTKDYIGGNIFGFLDDNNEMNTRADSYIYFDVTKNRRNGEEYFIILIQAKTHRDLLGKGIVNKLDELSFYIEDVLKELYPYYKDYSNQTEGIESVYARRNIYFILTQRNADSYNQRMMTIKDKTVA